MRDYSKISPRIWTGETGRQIRKLGLECQLVAFYLLTGPGSSMIGLYYLPLPSIVHATGASLKSVRKALVGLAEIGFAHYDEETEHVYVPNMARDQIGDRLKREDKRQTGVIRLLREVVGTPFHQLFLNKYAEAYELQDVLQLSGEGPSEGTFKVLPCQEQDQEQKQEHEREQEKTNHVEPERSTDRLSARLSANTGLSESIERIFSHWRVLHEHPRAQLDVGRRKVIGKALQSYSEADLCQAIGGYKNSPHHMGKNNRATIYDSIELMLRDSSHIDAGMKFFNEPPRCDLSIETRQIVSQTESWSPPEVRNANK